MDAGLNLHFWGCPKMDVKWMCNARPCPDPTQHPFYIHFPRQDGFSSIFRPPAQHPIYIHFPRENGCTMDLNFRPLGNLDVKWMWLSYLPGKLDAQLDVAFSPPQAKMSCFAWVWDYVCLMLPGRSCETPQVATTDTQTRERRGRIQFALHFQFTVLMDVRLGFNIHPCTPNISQHPFP